MKTISKWNVWFVPCFILVVAVLLFGQQASRTPRSSIGRYQLYYHPANFNQAFLLDSVTGATWNYAFSSYKPKIGSDSDKLEYSKFERVSVEGKYTSPVEKLVESLIKTEIEVERNAAEERAKRVLEQRERERKARQERIRKVAECTNRSNVRLLTLPGEQTLRRLLSRSEGSTFKFLGLLSPKWDNYKYFIEDCGFDDLFSFIREKYPDLAREFSALLSQSE